MLNKAIIMGRLVADPELRHTPNNVSVVSFTIACNRNFASKGAERQTDFIDIVAWRQTAEFVSRYFHKGSMIAVEGMIQTRTYEDKYGNKRKAVEVVADHVHFAESKSKSPDRRKRRSPSRISRSPPRARAFRSAISVSLKKWTPTTANCRSNLR